MRTIRPSSPIPTDRWLEEFTHDLARTDVSPLTVSGYRQDLSLFLRWFLERQPEGRLEDLVPEDLIQYRHHLVHKEGRKPATVNRRIQAIRRLCKWARRRGLIETDPSEEIKTIRVAARYQPAGLRDSEAHALLRVAGRSSQGLARRNVALIHLFIQTGLRVSEVVRLKVEDATMRDRSGSLRVREGKGRKAREVPLNAAARKSLRAYLAGREQARSDEFLFLTKRDSPMSIRAVQTAVSEMARRAKVDRLRVTPHTLRHTFALNYLQQHPGKLVELASLLGHESLDTTAIYTQPAAEDLARDLEATSLNVYG